MPQLISLTKTDLSRKAPKTDNAQEPDQLVGT
jgi:hypothetical protein